MSEQGRDPQYDRPVPDPTELTTRAVDLATAQSRRELNALRELLNERIEGDRMVERQKFATIIEKLVSHDNEFSFVEDRRVEQKQDTEKAVQAALSAAKEAVHEQTIASKEAIGVERAATNKALDALADTVKSGQEQQRRDTDDLKERVGRIEATGAGRVAERHGFQSNAGLFLSTATVVIATLAIIVTVILANQ